MQKAVYRFANLSKNHNHRKMEEIIFSFIALSYTTGSRSYRTYSVRWADLHTQETTTDISIIYIQQILLQKSCGTSQTFCWKTRSFTILPARLYTSYRQIPPGTSAVTSHYQLIFWNVYVLNSQADNMKFGKENNWVLLAYKSTLKITSKCQNED